MKKIFFLAAIFFLFIPMISFSQVTTSEPVTEPEGRVRTEFTGKIENWDITLGKDDGSFEGYLMNDVNRWTFKIGSIEGEVNSEFNDKYNSWEISIGEKVYHLKTWISTSWNKWELSGGDLKEKVTIQTLYNGSWDNWTMKREGVEVDFSTYLNNNYDDWSITGDVSKVTDGEKIAALFMPIFVSRIYRRNIAR